MEAGTNLPQDGAPSPPTTQAINQLESVHSRANSLLTSPVLRPDHLQALEHMLSLCQNGLSAIESEYVMADGGKVVAAKPRLVELPQDVLVTIIGNLGQTDRLNLMLTCRTMAGAVSHATQYWCVRSSGTLSPNQIEGISRRLPSVSILRIAAIGRAQREDTIVRSLAATNLTDKIKNLVRLEFYRIKNIAPDAILSVATLRNITSMAFYSCTHMKSVAPLACNPFLLRLDLIGCKHTEDVALLGQLPYLTSLTLNQLNSTSEADVTVMCAGLADKSILRELSIICVSGFTDEAMHFIGRITTLTELRLEQTQITDEGVEWIGRLTNLCDLSLNYNPNITEACVEFLTAIRDLTGVALSNPNMGDGAAALIGQHLRHIQTLDMGYCVNLTPTGILSLSVLPRLNQSDFSFCRSLPPIETTRLTRLTSISLPPWGPFLHQLPPDCVGRFAQSMGGLKDLTMDVGDDADISVLTVLTGLRRLVLDGNSPLKEGSVAALGAMTKLAGLQLTGQTCSYCEGRDLLSLSSLRTLTRLVLANCDALEDPVMEMIGSLPLIREILLDSCTPLNCDGLISLVRAPSLENLSLIGCPDGAHVDKWPLGSLANRMQILSLRACGLVDSEALLLTSLRALWELDVRENFLLSFTIDALSEIVPRLRADKNS